MLILSLIPYILTMLVNFYLLPLLIIDTGSGMFMLLLAVPLIVLIASFIYGAVRGFSFFIPVITALLFAPTFFTFFDGMGHNIEALLVYLVIYTGISLVGNLIGKLFYRKK